MITAMDHVCKYQVSETTVVSGDAGGNKVINVFEVEVALELVVVYEKVSSKPHQKEHWANFKDDVRMWEAPFLKLNHIDMIFKPKDFFNLFH
jgi:hypothetical protein